MTNPEAPLPDPHTAATLSGGHPEAGQMEGGGGKSGEEEMPLGGGPAATEAATSGGTPRVGGEGEVEEEEISDEGEEPGGDAQGEEPNGASFTPPGWLSKPDFHLRFTCQEEKQALLRLMGEEGISANAAILRAIVRWDRYPRSWKAMQDHLDYVGEELKLTTLLFEETTRNEEDLLELLLKSARENGGGL